MLARATVVLLIALNLGVALWWMWRPPSQPRPAPEQPAGVARLQLLSESGVGRPGNPAATPAPVPPGEPPAAEEEPAAAQVTTVPMTPATAGAATVDAPVCHRFGPFADRAAVEAARRAVQGQGQVRRAIVQAPASAGRGWRVLLPAQADRAAAQAVIARLEAAGFDDHFILGGDEANAIALGRFGSEEGARRHTAALQAAGFPARAEPLGATGPHWLDLAAAPDFDAEAAQRAAGAVQTRVLDCATMG